MITQIVDGIMLRHSQKMMHIRDISIFSVFLNSGNFRLVFLLLWIDLLKAAVPTRLRYPVLLCLLDLQTYMKGN